MNIESHVRDIVACMITVDRRLFGKENYLSSTLENLWRSGFFNSGRLSTRLCLFSSRLDRTEYMLNEVMYGAVDLSCEIKIYYNERSACENAGYALEHSGSHALDLNAKWVLFMEDDLDFCADFLDSVGRYLDMHGNDGMLGLRDHPRLIAFGCPYPQVSHMFEKRWKTWLYPINSFYGTQCFAIRPHDAISLGRYLQQNPTNRNPNEYDLMIHEWMTITYPDNKYFLASVPSFVEHIGRESVCTDREETHKNPSWPGRDWSFK